MAVEPHEGPEGSVFRIRGRAWRANRLVRVFYGVYCPPGAVCIDIAYLARVRTDSHGRFTFRVRAGEPQAGDDDRKIHAGGGFQFSQRTLSHRTITRKPRYEVGSSTEPSSRIVQRGLWATSQGWPSGSVNAAE